MPRISSSLRIYRQPLVYHFQQVQTSSCRLEFGFNKVAAFLCVLLSVDMSVLLKRGQQSTRALANLDEVVDQVLAMRLQEETSYNYRSFLPTLPDGTKDSRLNITWREKIVQWSYRVVDQ